MRLCATKAGLAAAVLGLLAGCGGGPGGESNPDYLRIGAYSVAKEAVHEGLIPAFKKAWKLKTGRDAEFEENYNASGTQARAIKSGLPSDVALLSLEDDMETLAKAGLVKSDWKSGPNRGIVSNSLVVIGVRDGNPKKIAGWSDLQAPGVGVLYPDPKTSGGAKWNVGAIYGATLLESKADGGEPDMARVKDALARVQRNVVNMDASGRQSVASFERGTGDVLVTYENELLLRKKSGKAIPYLIPKRTLLIESPGALVDANVQKHGNRELAEAFLAFVLAPEGQAILSEYGFRPIAPGPEGKAGQPLPDGVFRIADLGGWPEVNARVFGPDGIWTSIFLAR